MSEIVTVLAFDLAYRSTGWAAVSWDPNGEAWTVGNFGCVKVTPIRSPVTEELRARWADSGLRGLVEVISEQPTPQAFIYESPATWLLGKARSQRYRRMRTKTNSNTILAFGAVRERLYQALMMTHEDSLLDGVPIIAVDPRRWEHVLSRTMIGDCAGMTRKQQTKAAVAELTGMNLKRVSADAVDAIGIGLWGSHALATGELRGEVVS